MADPTGPDTAPATDASLLGRFRRGEGDAATELYLRYARRLRAVAEAQTAPDLRRRLDPDDIVQSVFRTFFRRAAAGQYDVPAGEELWKLFLVIGLNKVRAVAAHHRAAKRDVAATGGDIASAADTAGADDESLTALRLTIDEILSRLPPAYREVVELRVAGHEVGEIASQTGRAKRSVERILQEFRESLRGHVHEPD